MRESERYGRKVIEILRSYSSRAILIRPVRGKRLCKAITFRPPQSCLSKTTKFRAHSHSPSVHRAQTIRASARGVSLRRESAVPPQGKCRPACGKPQSRLRETSFPPAGNHFSCDPFGRGRVARYALDAALLTIKDAADFLRIRRRSLFYLISNGRLQAVKLSPRMTRISLDELQ